MAQKQTEEGVAKDIEMLDKLIKRYYEELEKQENANPKIGDFIKMIETRRKLTPADAEQKKFWNMLEEIRKEKLDKGKARKVRKRKAAKE